MTDQERLVQAAALRQAADAMVEAIDSDVGWRELAQKAILALDAEGQLLLDTYVVEMIHSRDVEWTNVIWQQDVDFVEAPSTVKERFELHVAEKVREAVLAEAEWWAGHAPDVVGYSTGSLLKLGRDRLDLHRQAAAGKKPGGVR